MPPIPPQDWTIIAAEGTAIAALGTFALWLVKFIIGHLQEQNNDLREQNTRSIALIAETVTNILQILTSQTIILQEWRAREEARRYSFDYRQGGAAHSHSEPPSAEPAGGVPP